MVQIPASLPLLPRTGPDAQGLIRRLESGATLTGRVLRGGIEGTTPIQIGISTLNLLLSEPIQPGTQVDIHSQSGKLMVEIKEQGSPLQDAGKNPQRQTATLPQGMLGSLSSPMSPVLAQVLQSNNLPATFETLQILQTALGNIPPEQGPVLALLLAKNVPITIENLAQVRERLRSRGNLGRELGRLSTEVSQLLRQGAIRGSERLATLLVEIQEILSWDQTGNLSERVDKLKDFLTSLEEKLLGGQTQRVQLDFRAKLFELDFLLAQAELDSNHPLRTATRKTVYLLEGAQLSGLTQVGEPDRSTWVFWRFPFPGDPTPTTIELAVRGDRDPEHQERYDPKNMEILLQVDLSILGPLRVRIRSLNELLRVVLSVTQVDYRDFIIKEIPLLVEALNQVGFPLVNTDVRVEPIAAGSLADEVDPLKDWEKKVDTARPSFDLKM